MQTLVIINFLFFSYVDKFFKKFSLEHVNSEISQFVLVALEFHLQKLVRLSLYTGQS